MEAGQGGLRLTAKERILLHLLEATKAVQGIEFPKEMAQDGIAVGTGVDRRHVPQNIRPLIAQDLIQEKRAHVTDVRQRRKVYQLTESGTRAAGRLRERLGNETIRVQDERGVRNATVREVLQKTGEVASMVALARRARRGDVIDLRVTGAAITSPLIERMSGVPRLGDFIGRKRELAQVTSEIELPRVFVVRGIAGIGKTWFGAKACDGVRGKRNLFWHRIHSWDTPQSVLADLGDFLAALGRPGLRTVIARGATADVRRILSNDLPGTKAFLVLDDGHEASVALVALLGLLKDAISEAEDVRLLVLTRYALPFYDRRDVVLDGLVKEIELVGLSMEDLTTLLSTDARSLPLLKLARQISGHPLLLELLRATPDAVTAGDYVQDVNRFLQEAVYRQLSVAERRMMKLAALYRLPVPREALEDQRDGGLDVLMALTDKALVRPIGSDRFEVHDSIREFFAGIATPTERMELGGLCARRLEGLAMQAEAEGDFSACAAYLKNALELPLAMEHRLEIQERLGDANDRLGDLPATLMAYKQALKSAENPETAARLHRKSARALILRWDIHSAASEIEAGFGVLGDSSGLERAWLDLLKARLSERSQDWVDARSRGESSLRVFSALKEDRGKGEALILLSDLEMHSSDADPRAAEARLGEAKALLASIRDPRLAVEIRFWLAHYLGYHRPGRLREAFDEIGAIEAITEAVDDPTVRLSALMLRGQFEVDFRADYTAAEIRFREARVLARRTYDAAGLALAETWLALVAYFRGQLADAQRELERLYGKVDRVAQPDRTRPIPERVTAPAEMLWQIGECCLLQGNFKGLHRVRLAVEESRPVSSSVLGRLVRAMDLFGAGDHAASLVELEDATKAAEDAFAVQGAPFIQYPHLAHFYCAAVLRMMGRDGEAGAHRARATQILESYGLKAMGSFLSREEPRVLKVLQTAGGLVAER